MMDLLKGLIRFQAGVGASKSLEIYILSAAIAHRDIEDVA